MQILMVSSPHPNVPWLLHVMVVKSSYSFVKLNVFINLSLISSVSMTIISLFELFVLQSWWITSQTTLQCQY